MTTFLLWLVLAVTPEAPCPTGTCPLLPPPPVASAASAPAKDAPKSTDPTVIKVNGESWCLMPGDNWIVGREFTVTGPAGSAKMLFWYSPARKAIFISPDWKVLTP